MNLSSIRTSSICIIGSALGLLLIHHFYYFYGHFGYDDMHYARLAHQLLQGDINWSDHYSYRFTIIGLTAFSYKLFGINDFSSGLPALLLSFGTIGIFYSIFHKKPLLLATTLALYFSYKWNLFFSDKLMPDLYVSFFCLIGWYGYYKHSNKNSNNYTYPILSAIGLFLAFNSKGTIILLVPLFGYYLLKDIYRGSIDFWRIFIPIIGALLIFYLGLIKYFTGSAFSRFESILSNQYINDCSYDLLGLEVLIDRLGTQFINLITSEGLYIPILLTLVFTATNRVYSKQSKNHLNTTTTVLILFLSANFMSISLTSYNPICIDPRHIMFVTPIIAICISSSLGQFLDSKINHYKFFSTTALIGAALILIPTWKYAEYCKSLNYSKIKKSYLKLTKDNAFDGTIICSETFKNYMNYYSGFDANNSKTYVSISDLSPIPTNHEQKFVAFNWYADWHAGMDNDKLKTKVTEKGIELTEEVIYSNQHVVIYSTKDNKPIKPSTLKNSGYE